MMVLSDKEKQEVIEKCRQKGVLISERDLDYMYYGSSDGCLYYGNGSPVTQAAIGVAIAETLQYQVEKGDAEKLNMSQAEIEKVLATCNRLGVPMNKEELENMYLDKDGNIYGNDGTPIKDTILVTAITQTDTFAAKYAKMADRRAKMPIKKAADISPSYVDPAKLPEPVVIPTEGFSMSALPGIPSDSSDGSGVSSMTPVSDRASAGISISGSGGTSDRDESRLESIFGGQKPTIQKEFAGIRNGKSKIVTNPRNGTRRRANSNRNGQNRKGQNGEGQSQGDQGGQGEDNQDQPEPNKRDSNNGTSKGENPGGYNGETFPEQQPEEGMSIPGKVAVGAGVCTAVGVGKAVYAATFFLPLQVIDNHSFISSILKILFQ
jgi:hypothetical protein